MLTRALFVFIAILAILLTVNEQRQEQRAHDHAARLNAPPAGAETPGRQIPVGSAGYPSSIARATSTPQSPGFVAHRVRLRDETRLRQAPSHDAPPIASADAIPAETVATAIDQRGDWYLLEIETIQGWAPIVSVVEP